jgi:1-phosphofructokinase family hexose kinase
MIYTITLSPYLDMTIEVEELFYDDVNRVVEERRRAGGKGIDVSRVIRELGGQSVVLGLAGGHRGLELEGALISEGILCDLTRMQQETKANIIIYQRKKRIGTLIGGPEPLIDVSEVGAFFDRVRQIPAGSYVTISGAPPDSVNDVFYAQLVTTLREKGVKVIVDADGPSLKMAVNAGPCLVKPNLHEFGRLVDGNVTDMDQIVERSRAFLETVDYMVVSMGGRGALGLAKGLIFHAVPPKVKVRNSMGAGDALVAGIVYGLGSGYSFRDSVVLGTACGTASTLVQQNGLCRKEDVLDIQKDIVVKMI